MGKDRRRPRIRTRVSTSPYGHDLKPVVLLFPFANEAAFYSDYWTLSRDGKFCRHSVMIPVRVSGTVVHPAAEIRATNGPIVMAENNNVEELAVIENLWVSTLPYSLKQTRKLGIFVLKIVNWSSFTFKLSVFKRKCELVMHLQSFEKLTSTYIRNTASRQFYLKGSMK